MHTVEYRVKEVKRFLITRYEHKEDPENGTAEGSCSDIGEFQWESAAFSVAEALGMKDNAHIKGAIVKFPVTRQEPESTI